MDRSSLYSNGSVEDALKKLNLFGITSIKDYLSNELVTELLEESKIILQEKPLQCHIIRHNHVTNESGITQTINPEIASTQDNLPNIESVFRGSFMNRLCYEYYKPFEYTLNPEVLVSHLKESENRILPWHFDRLQTLKFWIYLTDTNEDNGAMEYCPGTHWEGRYRSQFHLSIGDLVREIPNDIPEERIINGMIIDCKAGELMIFDPDGFHRGGVIRPGKERYHLRGDSFPNIGRKHGDKKGPIQRILGDNTKDRTLNRNGLMGSGSKKLNK